MMDTILTLLTPSTILFAFLGLFVGMATGVLPGFGPSGAMGILFPMTFYMAPHEALIVLFAIYYGSQYGDNIAATTMRIAHGSSIVICQDGYAMAKQGKAGKALAIGAISTLVAGLTSLAMVSVIASPVSELALNFGSPEYAVIIFSGIVLAIVGQREYRLSSSLAGAGLGLALGYIGTDLVTGESRWTMGIDYLADGIPLTLFVVGVFGISEVINQLSSVGCRPYLPKQDEVTISRAEFKKLIPSVARGTMLGGIIGLLPGGGSIWASFASHGLEKSLSQEHGPAVAGPSAASEAAANTGLIPLLCFGIPENAAMAVLFSALMVHGFQPGPSFINNNPDMITLLISSAVIGNVLLAISNIFGISFWIKLLQIPKTILYSSITALCLFGAYSARGNPYDVVLCVMLGILGWACNRAKISILAVSIGFILGPMLLDKFHKSMLISNGSIDIFITRPLSMGILAGLGCILLCIAVAPYLQNIVRRNSGINIFLRVTKKEKL